VKRLEDEGRIPVVPVYVDSPMALEALNFYAKRTDELDDEMSQRGRAVRMFATKRFTVTRSAQESKQITASRLPSIVISSAGMATGGRVLHHLRRTLPDDRNTILFVGYQSVGTRGRDIRDGAKTTRIHGEEITINARVESFDSMSAHADSNEIMRWLKNFTRPPQLTCLVHGEAGPMDTLKARIERELKWTVRTPNQGERISL